MKYKYTIEQLKEAVSKSLSVAQVCRELGIIPAGGNYKTILFKLKENKIDTSHFTGQAWNVGSRFRTFAKKYTIEEILVEDSPYKTPSKLKDKLIFLGIKKEECEVCKNTMWLNQKIKLEIHHINGINTDNRIENLQILCPNCHSFTDNFRGKNINRSALSEKREVEYRKFKEALTENADGNLEPSLINKEGAETLHGKPKSKKVKIQKTCVICKSLFSKNKKYCSYECKNIAASVAIPSYQDLVNAFRIYKSFLQVGNYFKVSDNAVRKWCIRYGLIDMVKKKSSARTE